MNVLHINDFCWGLLLKGLKEEGVETDFIQSSLRSISLKYPDWKYKLPFLQLKDTFTYLKKTGNNAYDLIHSNGAYAGINPALLKHRFILHCQGSDIRRNLFDILMGPPTKLAIKNASKVLFSTPDLYYILKKFRKDSIFLPHPIDTSQFKPLNDKTNIEKLRILLLSGIRKNKGSELAISALNLLKERSRSKITVDAVCFDESITSKINNGNIKINLISPMPHKEIPNLIRKYDLILGQYEVGSLGLAELETMACGKPLITYFKFYNWYPDKPPIVSAKSPKEISNAISILIDDEAYRMEIGVKGREWVLKYHEYHLVSQRLREIYEECIRT